MIGLSKNKSNGHSTKKKRNSKKELIHVADQCFISKSGIEDVWLMSNFTKLNYWLIILRQAHAGNLTDLVKFKNDANDDNFTALELSNKLSEI